MILPLRLEDRTWDRSRHLQHIDQGTWVPMRDADGAILPGILGMSAVEGVKRDGTTIGSDYVRMEPGSRFPLHEHEGDHVIYFISGEGFVRIDREDIPVRAGHCIHIPGEYPHGVWVDPSATEPFVFVAVGHPHKHVDAPDRMRHPHRDE